MNKRVDWEKRDQEVKIQVESAVQEILQKDKPERVTLRKVGIMTGLKALLEQKLDKLPLTKTYLEETVESVKMFQDGRIQWAIALLEEQGEEVKSWKVKRFAGITDQLSEKVEKIIDSYYFGILVDQIPCNDK
ncbi:TnsD family Tn7-like transposition protein [Cyanobacterium stanieri]|uniref:TnsD family Tn7-like transposition protein n=1 Tax=Cyanobacterium stanieri TaxID=102235 RepID=UPI001882C748